MSIILFFLVLFALILVHEWGHFIVAKLTGMRVDEFGIGFPPKLFGKVWHQTEYTLNLLPIGGFVRIYGENSADAAADEAAGAAVSGAFTSKSKWAQAAVLLAGVTMNVIFAWVLFASALMIGVPTAVDEATASPQAELMVQSVVAGTPAAAAAIPPGAVITQVTIEGTDYPAATPSAFQKLTEDNAGVPLSVTYTLSGQTHTVSVTPKTGLIADQTERAAIGVSLALVENQQQPIHLALYNAAKQTGQMLWLITTSIIGLIGGALTGTADLSSVTGPVGIVGMVGQAAHVGFTSLLLFTAMISLNLAVINLLPFPALDGGRLLFVAIEAVTRRAMAPQWVARLNTAGFALLMLLMVAVTWHDVVKLLS